MCFLDNPKWTAEDWRYLLGRSVTSWGILGEDIRIRSCFVLQTTKIVLKKWNSAIFIKMERSIFWHLSNFLHKACTHGFCRLLTKNFLENKLARHLSVQLKFESCNLLWNIWLCWEFYVYFMALIQIKQSNDIVSQVRVYRNSQTEILTKVLTWFSSFYSYWRKDLGGPKSKG